MKKSIVILIFILVFQSRAYGNELPGRYVILINQVRGESCFQPGTTDTLKRQLSVIDSTQGTATFTVRYDALNDDAYISMLSGLEQIDVGGMLEIIPSLADDAGVSYKGDLSSWHEARYSMLSGYSQEDRKRLIDTYMDRYYAVFGSYPKTTSAWIVDGWSLSYMRNTYGIITHEITREQWGTDTYNLHGGPPHYPYFANLTWPLIPGNSDVLIARQTAADWYQNYANLRHSYTSQPNDYLQTGNDFDYFSKLSESLLNQNQNPYSVMVLGIENNMEDIYQDEYAQQLEYLTANYPQLAFVSLKDFYLNMQNDLPTETSVISKDLTGKSLNTSIYVTTNTYRARLLSNGQGLYLTDLRIYSPTLVDPYFNRVLTDRQAFWIAPFMLDSSRYKLELNPQPLLSMPWIFRVPLKVSDYILNPVPDFEQLGEYLSLSDGIVTNIELDTSNESIELSFTNGLNQQQSITFTVDSIVFPYDELGSIHWSDHSDIHADFNENDRMFERIFESKNNLRAIITLTRKEHTMVLKPEIEGTCCANQESLDLSPDFANALSTSEVFVYRHNEIGISNESPIRLMIQAYDENGLPVSTQDISDIEDFNTDVFSSATKHGYRMVDISSESPVTDQIVMTVNDVATEEVDVRFILNCSNELIECITHPRYFISYVGYLWSNKFASN